MSTQLLTTLATRTFRLLVNSIDDDISFISNHGEPEEFKILSYKQS